MTIDESRIKEFFQFYLLKRAERSDIHNSFRRGGSIIIRHSMKFRTSGVAGQKNGQCNTNRNFWGSVPKSAVVGFRNSQ